MSVFYNKGQIPNLIEKHSKTFPAHCVCPRPTFVCAERPWQTDRYVERCGNPGRRKAAETSLIRVEQSPGFWPQQGNSPPPPQPPCHVRPTASHTNTKIHTQTDTCLLVLWPAHWLGGEAECTSFDLLFISVFCNPTLAITP